MDKKNDKDVLKLLKLVEDYIELIDEEMEHGCYETPECPPYQYDDEEDYYGKHEEIVNRVCDARMKIRKFANKYRKNTK